MGVVSAVALLAVAAWPVPAAAKTEHCMLDGDDVKSTFFVAPTTDTTPVRVVMKGVTYSIPRNYFSYPQTECRTGETRGILLRMTLPDLKPATAETWDSLYGESAGRDDDYIVVSVDQQIVSVSRIMESYRLREIKGRSAAEVDGLQSMLIGPIDFEGRHQWDLYYKGSRESPEIIISCRSIRPDMDSECRFYLEHRGLTWDPWSDRKYLSAWSSLVEQVKAKIDSFIVKTGD